MLRVVAIALGLASALSPAVAAEEKLNLSLVGAHDLAGRSAYQPVIER